MTTVISPLVPPLFLLYRWEDHRIPCEPWPIASQSEFWEVLVDLRCSSH